ncbi:MAG: cell division protein FtsZ [candidate division KSB1 bacterium]|nr:cell division protein FtsZ [candidate division KSB1 bacterium]
MSKKDSDLKAKDEELQSILNEHRTIIRVVGTGGAGNNTISHLKDVGINGVETVAVNTDAQALLFSRADDKILIGKNISHGLGAGSDPQIGEQSARESEEEIRKSLEGSDLVFITCGLGGGTGTGSAPVIAEIARSLNALTISVITLPFNEEGTARQDNAVKGLERLRENSDTVIVVQNNRLLDLVPDLPLNAAFKVADEILVNAVKGITELVTERGLINLDFSDIKSIMKDGDTAMIGIGESDAENKAIDAVQKAIENPLLDVDITGAKSALVNITGDESMSIGEARSVMVAIAQKLDPGAKIIWGARIDQEMKGKMRVLLIATGTRGHRLRGKAEADLIHVDAEPLASEATPPTAEPEPVAEEAQPIFDIKETETYTAMAAPKSTTPQAPPAPPVRSQKIFDQIFAEEVKGDLDILKESLSKIDLRRPDEKIFRNVKNACVALQNSAQLFANDKIEEFTIFIGELFEEILTRKIRLTQAFIPYLHAIPKILDGLISNDNNATKDAQTIIEKLTILIDQQDNKPKSKPKEVNKPESPNIIKDELRVEVTDLKSKVRLDVN